ncbi:MAG TPA: alpha/beta fold hydrolase [Pararobbsia sp.]|jgi:proline iminopeptidase|nr:alpha/beta fold hydrolase [Pararobbsia sp.]
MDIPQATQEGMLDVGDGHSIYWRSHGNDNAPAIVVLHGGPGGAMNLGWSEFLDARKWRVIFFDQRGCGRSTPFGELRGNTLGALVGDIERLRARLGIERWALFGGSWGTTLALAYGAAHADRCLGFLLRGIFLARPEDIQWFLWDVRRIFPDAHDAFLDAIEQACGLRPRNAREILAYAQAPLSKFDAAGAALAQAWTDYEKTLSAVVPIPAPSASAPSASAVAASHADAGANLGMDAGTPTDAAARNARSAVSMALLERHYMADDLPPEPALLRHVERFSHLPCHIVHGRFDVVCPADQALALAQAWPGAQLSIVDASGHWTFEPGIAAALRRDAEQLASALACASQ